MVQAYLGPHVDPVWENLNKGLCMLVNGKHWGDEFARIKHPGTVLPYDRKRANDGPLFSAMLDEEKQNGTSYLFSWGYICKHVDRKAAVNKIYNTKGKCVPAQGRGKKSCKTRVYGTSVEEAEGFPCFF